MKPQPNRTTYLLAAAALLVCCALVGAAGHRLWTVGWPDLDLEHRDSPHDARRAAAESKSSAGALHAGLGVTGPQLQALLDTPAEPRFRYDPPVETGEGSLQTGRLGDDLVMVEFEGPTDNLRSVRLVMPLAERRQTAAGARQSAKRVFLLPHSGYMTLLAREIAPRWKDANAWIEASLPEVTSGESAATTQGGVRFSLARLERYGLVVFSAEKALDKKLAQQP